LLFDCPGQAELYTHHESFATLAHRLVSKLDIRLASVHCIDSHHVTDPGKFIAAALLAMTAMMRLELPAINLLTKLDMLAAYGELRE
jgi:GPN-loop GTPase